MENLHREAQTSNDLSILYNEGILFISFIKILVNKPTFKNLFIFINTNGFHKVIFFIL